jgi:uncharacterized membrane protein YfhO
MLAGSDHLSASARVLHYGTNEVVVEADLDRPGWLVLTDAEAPGWRATASEAAGPTRETPIYRADGAFRSVYLPSAGRWTVRFSYEPTSFRVGLLVSALSALALVLAGWFFLRRGRCPASARP